MRTEPRPRRAVSESLERRLLMVAGDPDVAFGNGGQTSLAFPGAPLEVVDAALLPDGKVIVAGTKGGGIAVARLNADGTVDSTFGNGGLFESSRRSQVTSVAVHTDAANAGKIVIGLGSAGNTEVDLAIGRLLASGSGFDSGFGENGIADVGNNFAASNLSDVVVQRDGKIVGGGAGHSGNYDFAIVRYNANGSLDTTFAGDGVNEYGFGGDEQIAGLTIDYNGDAGSNPLYGTIVAVGRNNLPDRYLLLRVLPNGTPDSSFDGDGKLVSPDLSGAAREYARAVTVQPGGRIVVAGFSATSDLSGRNFLVAGYAPGGGLDSNFGLAGGGVTELDLGVADEALAITLGYHGSPGNLVVSGTRDNMFAAVALTRDGQLDTRFSGDGILTTNVPGRAAGLLATGAAYPPNRRLILAGGSGRVARYVDVGSVITVGTFQPNMYEQGQQSTSFLVARTRALPFAETVFLSTSGTATPRGLNRDFDGTNITFGDGVTTTTNVVIPSNQTFVEVTLTPIDDTRVEGDETITFAVGTTAQYDAGAPNAVTLVIRDNDVVGGPAVTTSAFVYDFGPPQRVTFRFSQDVSQSIGSGDFTVTGPAGAVTFGFAHDGVTNTSTLSFSGIFPDGDYTARAIAAGITNAAGQPMPVDHDIGFFFLNGDANRDRRVNLADFNRLATNFGQSNRTFSQGDFNYDGVVNLQDFNILASRFGTALPSQVGTTGAKRPLFGQQDMEDEDTLGEMLV